MRDKLQRSLFGFFAHGATVIVFMANVAHNLPFVHACAVLSDALHTL
ncbi:MAG: hypothetical protein K8F29_13680 [Kofleriaceae bacterium]|nr:hypothetical protein [Candidatus Methylomirabilis lanthanidiphila]